MRFTQTLNWLWLLPLAGTIVLLWRQRPRREEVSVPSLRLWLGLTAPESTSPARRTLRRHLLLFLQLLTVFLLVLALARPFLYAQALAGQHYVLVIDNSASMQATDMRPSRLDAAREQAAALVRTLRPEDTAAVVLTSPRALALCRPTADPARLRAALAQIPPSDTPGDTAGALSLAQSLLGGVRSGAHVWAYSDGISFPSQNALPAAPPSTERRLISIGTPHPDNIGIVSLALTPGASGGQTLTVRLQQAGQVARPELPLSLSVDGALQDARQVVFTKGTALAEFNLPLSQTPQSVTVRLEHLHDALASDNAASLTVAPAQPIHVLLVSAGSLFLERGLAALPQVQTTEVPPAPGAPQSATWAAADVVVLDGAFPLPAVPPGRYLTFGRAGLPTPFVFAPQPPANVLLTQQNSADPLLRFVDLRGVQVQSVASVQAAAWAHTLAGGSRGPLLAAGQNGASRVVSVAFAPADSDWPLRAAFPLFLANSIHWLADANRPGAALPEYAAGQVAQVTLPPGAGPARLRAPDGSVRPLPPSPPGDALALANLSQVGIYSVALTNGARFPVPVNLVNPAASALLPRPVLSFPQAGLGSAQGVWHRTPREWGTAAALLALLLLGAEWWVYHRRA